MRGKLGFFMAANQQASRKGHTAAILARLFRPEHDDLPAAAAKEFLKIRFNSRELNPFRDLVKTIQDAPEVSIASPPEGAADVTPASAPYCAGQTPSTIRLPRTRTIA
jgi:hypothetical protein